MADEVKIHPSWHHALKAEFSKPYFIALKTYLKGEKSKGKIIYPPGKLIFNAFDRCPFDRVKVVILGQDPYHGPDQAMGLSFSVPKGVAIPASLKNIYKELHTDLELEIPSHGDLSSWADQGVFLLNAILTVEKGNAGSHQKSGWQEFTDAVIKELSNQKTGIVFLLWGNFAKSKKVLIDLTKHEVLEAAHPSPLAGGAFFGCRHFSKTNTILQKNNKSSIQWNIEN